LFERPKAKKFTVKSGDIFERFSAAIHLHRQGIFSSQTHLEKNLKFYHQKDAWTNESAG
jgi:hypothetical protein